MPYTNILSNCVHSIAGIKQFKLATRDVNSDPLDFPLDFILQSGSSNTLIVNDNVEDRILTINNTQISYRLIFPDSCSYVEKEVENRRGKYFEKKLEWSMPKVNLTTNNQLKSFLFSSAGEFAISNALLFFTDSNNQNWISGIDIPFVLQDFDLKTGARGGGSDYKLSYLSNSYLRTFKYISQ